MGESLRLLAVLAHPDDESLGFGGTLARYAAEGVQAHLVTATRGERGRFFAGRPRPPDDEVGRARELELRAAAEILGIGDVELLGYPDSEVDRADPVEASTRIAASLRRLKPQVVITFDPFGAYGHPDHIAISQLTTAATVAAAAPDPAGAGRDPPHAVSKLYYMAWTRPTWEAYQSAFRKLVSRVDGEERQVSPWPDWAVTTRIDTRDHWPTVWRAVRCHRSQLSVYEGLERLSPEHHQALWGSQEFYRAYSLVNGGRALETDLFEGLR